MIKLLRKLSQPLVWRMYKWYLSSPRWYTYEDLQIRLLPTVFHPGWLVSTKTLLNLLSELELTGKNVLELGAGSGLIALVAARKGALVTASDINPMAIQAIHESARHNKLNITIIESDLFDAINEHEFDYILINPPYFPKDPADDWDKAFFCGSHFEYFHKLFGQIGAYMSDLTKTYMILNEYCNMEIIDSIARKNKLLLTLTEAKMVSGEKQFIFTIENEK